MIDSLKVVLLAIVFGLAGAGVGLALAPDVYDWMNLECKPVATPEDGK